METNEDEIYGFKIVRGNINHKNYTANGTKNSQESF